MSDLIGRFLSFEDHLGRGLVKFAYYLALFFLVVSTLYHMVRHLFDGDIGDFLLEPFQFVLWLVLFRVAAELALAILSIDDQLQGGIGSMEGFEAGLTPSPSAGPKTTVYDTPKSAPTEPQDETPSIDNESDGSDKVGPNKSED